MDDYDLYNLHHCRQDRLVGELNQSVIYVGVAFFPTIKNGMIHWSNDYGLPNPPPSPIADIGLEDVVSANINEDSHFIVTLRTGEERDWGEFRIPAELADKHYVHKQMSAAEVWEVEHNLNKYPSVSVVDSSGNLVMGDVQYVSSNKLKIKFTSAFSGKAYIN